MIYIYAHVPLPVKSHTLGSHDLQAATQDQQHAIACSCTFCDLISDETSAAACTQRNTSCMHTCSLLKLIWMPLVSNPWASPLAAVIWPKVKDLCHLQHSRNAINTGTYPAKTPQTHAFLTQWASRLAFYNWHHVSKSLCPVCLQSVREGSAGLTAARAMSSSGISQRQPCLV